MPGKRAGGKSTARKQPKSSSAHGAGPTGGSETASTSHETGIPQIDPDSQIDPAFSDVDASLIAQLQSAIGTGPNEVHNDAVDPHLDPQLHAQDNQSQQEFSIDDQLLLDSLRSAMASEGAGKTTNTQDGNHNAAQNVGGAASDDMAMQDAFLLARQLIQGSQGEYPAQGAVDNQQLHHLSLPGALDGPADAATLQAVQSVLQELGSSWPSQPSGPKRNRQKRYQNLTPEERERYRVENKLRKRRWRDGNSGRNKDNDLRARLLKRATSIFGVEDTPAKLTWVEDEFRARRDRRLIHEGGSLWTSRKHLMKLFQRSNQRMEPTLKRFTAGAIPDHLLGNSMVPPPKRPQYKRSETSSSRETVRPRYVFTLRNAVFGVPPKLSEFFRRPGPNAGLNADAEAQEQAAQAEQTEHSPDSLKPELVQTKVEIEVDAGAQESAVAQTA